MELIPKIIDGREDYAAWNSLDETQFRSKINDLIETHGALLFRNFPLKTKSDFAEFIRKILPADSFLDYTGGTSPRKNLGEGVYTSTKMPFFLNIPLHSEMAYRRRFPQKIFFFCEKAPLVGGETPIVDTRRVYLELPKELRTKVEEQGIKYFRHLKNTNLIRKFLSHFNPMIETGTWQFVFKTNDREVVETYCRENDFTSKWFEDGSVILETHLPAVLSLKGGKVKTWFNSFHFFQIHYRIWDRLFSFFSKVFLFLSSGADLSARFGSGEKLSSIEISLIVDAYELHKVTFSWCQGDVLFLDNTIMAHGRHPYLGQRKILVALAEEGMFNLF
jgi:hypothetical protein